MKNEFCMTLEHRENNLLGNICTYLIYFAKPQNVTLISKTVYLFTHYTKDPLLIYNT